MARLFHSLVVCGAGLTLLQCGGRSVGTEGGETGEGSESGASRGGSGGKGSAGSGVTMGGIAAGGATTTPTAGGPVLMPVGGSGPTTNPGVPKPAGPTAQWSCNTPDAHCSDGLIDITNLDCQLDVTRPAAPAVCQGDAVFTCLKGRYHDEPVLFNCECQPPAPDGNCVCPAFMSFCARPTPTECDPFRSECGCALTCILK